MAVKSRPIRHRLEYAAFLVVECIVAALPIRWAAYLSEQFALFIVRSLPKKLSRYNIAAENLRNSFGDEMSEADIQRTIEQMWIHLFRLVVEIIQMPRKSHRENFPDVYDFRNREEVVRAMCSGRPVIMLSGHFGNWEAAMTAFGSFGFPGGIVARDLDNPYLHNWFARARQRTGGKLISKKGGGGEIAGLLEQKGLVGLLCDQDAGAKGLFVPFFGRNASTFKSIALLSMEYRALICVGYAIRKPDNFDENHWVKYELGCEEIIDPDDYQDGNTIKEITERYTAALERAIRRQPEQYFWLHRRWKSKPKERKRKAKMAVAA
ncbi:lysophospholipid acyltransferase family protein [Calycomorphotria hydatis]|uniref:Lipid A biosynthesis lauroyl acyltransferase n=1 Tax=Calycomorphotria hydatis TaxID=2528027 RepID=A0A517T382_9PLAN|nr:lysophospholipid acyltransferase family protein [Calycomorphotria hydatis]QDT62829.1 Lipid A biosynthesis lauroyl acyltransferase [Calycomorphotria hydatis]